MSRFRPMASRFLASAMSRLDGSAADGIHLLWTAPLRIGYSIDGFDIQRRENERRELTCYRLTDGELATLHQILRVRVPPGRVGMRRTPCPAFPQVPPDEPAPDTGRRSEEGIDFRLPHLRAGSNPRREPGLTLRIHGADRRLADRSEVRRSGAHTGLDCHFRTEIELDRTAASVELLLVRFAAAPRVAAIGADGAAVITASMSVPEGQPERIVLEGRGLSRIVIEAPQAEVLLLDVNVTRSGDDGDETYGRRSRFLQPPFRLAPPASASGVLSAVSTTPICRVYDIELSRPHLTVRVHAGLPAMLAIAMRDGKAVSTQMLSATGGEQSVGFLNQFVDRVLLYAGAAATHLTICTEKLEPKEDEERWRDVPLIAKNIHVPVRSVNPTLTSTGMEAALATSRLLPGESFDGSAFDEVAALMNDSSQDAPDGAPPTRTVLTRDSVNDPFVQLQGWPYALSLLVEPDWRRMLGFGFIDKGSGLTQGTFYDYRITGRFRRRELDERLLGFHTLPLDTTLPGWFQLDSVLVETPAPAVVGIFPAPPPNALRAVGTKGIALTPSGNLGQSLSVTFPTPTRRAIFEFEPSLAQGLQFRAKTTSYLAGLTGTTFSGAVPATRRVTLEFQEPVDTIAFFGAGFLYGVRVATEPVPPGSSPDDVVAVSVTIPGVRYEPTAAPPPPPFLGTTNLQQAPLPGDVVAATEQPTQYLGFRLSWLPPPAAGTTVAPWPPDLATAPPFDVLGFHLERRRADTSGPFTDIDAENVSTRIFGNRSSRRQPSQLHAGLDMLAAFAEEVQPEPPVSVLMDAEDTLRSPALDDGPPPGSLHQYRIFSVDVTGRRSTTPTLGSIVRLEKRVAPPQPVGPTTPAPEGVQRPVGVTARVLQSLDTHLTPSDRALLGTSTNAIVLEWAWTEVERTRDPFATEFRVYFRPVAPDYVQGLLTGTATASGNELEMAAALSQAIPADAMKGRYIRSEATAFKVISNTAGQAITIRFEKSALDPSLVPIAGAFEMMFPPDAAELRPELWPERTAVVPITAQENYQQVFRDRVAPSATAPDIRVWVGVSAADAQSYIADSLDGAVPNGGRPGNESSIVAIPAHARYLGRPVFTVPPPLPAVPEQVTNEPADDRVLVALDLPALLPGVPIPAGFTVVLERIGVDALLNRASVQPEGTIGVRLPNDTLITYTLANPTDHAAFVEQIESADGRRVEGRFVMDLLIRHLEAMAPLWVAALPAPVAWAPATDTLPGKAERYVHRVRLVDQAGHVSAGGAILPQFVRVPSLASPAPSFKLTGTAADAVTLAARARDSVDLKWLVVFMLASGDSEGPDQRTLERAQLLRLPNRRDLYPSGGIRVRLADGSLLEPAAVIDTGTGTLEVPDRVITASLAAGFEKRVSVWLLAMTRDGITSRLAGPQTAFTGAAPLQVPPLIVTVAGGVDQASWPALTPGVEASVERSVDAAATWVRVTPWTTESAVTLPRMTGARDYRLQLRASHGRRAAGPPTHLG